MGARSNPAPTGLLPRLAALHARLQAENQGYPTPHPVRRKPQPLLKTIPRILQEADGPLHVREIHARAETLLGRPVSWTSLKDRLSIYSSGDHPRLRRVQRGWYRRTVDHRRR